MITGSLKVGNKVLLSIAPTKADGSPAILDDTPQWTNAGAGTLEPAPDGLSAWLRNVPLKETADVTVSADADLDEDEVRTLSENFVVLGRSNEIDEASALGASIGAEEPDTEAEPEG